MIELTRFSKTSGVLSKRISLGADGKPLSDGSSCAMARGTAHRVRLKDAQALAAMIGTLGAKDAIAAGALHVDLPDTCRVLKKIELERLNGAREPDQISRSLEHLGYVAGEPAFALIDFDAKGMAPGVCARIDELGGPLAALEHVLPELAQTSTVYRPSTSAALYHVDTGEAFPSSGGFHLYVQVADGADIERFLRTLHDRAWLAGLGWMMLGAGGQFLERSIVDRMVGSPERLIFEAAPIVEHPLRQDATARAPVVHMGKALDTTVACPPLTDEDQVELEELKDAEQRRLRPEAERVRRAFVQTHAEEISKRTGITPEGARRIIERQLGGELGPEITLPWDDRGMTGCTVADVLADPNRFLGATLADPIEGVAYGVGKAMVLRKRDGTLIVNSYAHGGAIYTLFSGPTGDADAADHDGDGAGGPPGDEPPPPSDNDIPDVGTRTTEEPWPDPIDFLADDEATGTPELLASHLPPAINDFVFDTASRLGIDPAAVALGALVSLASVADDAWRLQPKVHDYTWTEQPRIWGAIVGDPSIRKTPLIKAVTRPIEKLEAQAREQHEQDLARHKCAMKEWKAAGSDPTTEPRPPRLTRYLIESATVEALSEVLRTGGDAKYTAAAGKVLVRQDELSELVGSFDRYSKGGNGGADRGAYLRLYNGGHFSVDRIGRGSFHVPNWSACLLGGIQPEPIRRIANESADDGLLQRICYAVPGHNWPERDHPPNAEALRRYSALFPALAAMHPARGEHGPLVVKLHADCHQHRVEAQRHVDALMGFRDAGPRLKSALGKMPGLWARLCLIFHLIGVADAHAQGTDPGIVDLVSSDTAARVTAYLRDILIPHLLRANDAMFGGVETSHAEWIAGHILARRVTRLADREIRQYYRALRAPGQRRERQEAMESLETVGWCRLSDRRRSGASLAWDINPQVHIRFAERAEMERTRRDAITAKIKRAVSGTTEDDASW